MKMIRRGLAATTLAAMLGSGIAQAQPPLQELPAILRLQPSQHPAWRAYKDAAAISKADAAGEAGEAAILNAMTTPQRLDALRTRLRDEASAFERQAAATQAFYAVLSPEQKRVFDDVTRLPLPRPPGPTRPRSYAQTLRVPPTIDGLPPPAR